MRRRRPALRWYITGVIGAGWAAAVAFAPSGVEGDFPLALALLGMATFAQLRPIHLSQKIKVTVDDTATFAAALLLSPGLALIVASGSKVLAYAGRRGGWFEGGFNAANSGLSTLTVSLVYVGLRGEHASVAAHVPAAVVAAAGGYLVSRALVDVAVGLQLRRNPLATWWPVHRRDLPQTIALYALGLLMAIVADVEPLAIVLFALPVVAVFASMRQAVRLRTQTRAAILEFAKLIDLRDPYTHGHSQRVADFAERIARQLRFAPSQVELVRESALLHDLGKIRTADRVLHKAGPLDPDEQREMHLHAEAGAELLQRLPDFWEGASLVRSHHERYDGAGYPRGLKGSEVPLEASVIAVADAWDAMTSDRPYRRALAFADARAELIRWRGSQWEPAVVDALLTILDEPVGVAEPRRGIQVGTA